MSAVHLQKAFLICFVRRESFRNRFLISISQNDGFAFHPTAILFGHDDDLMNDIRTMARLSRSMFRASVVLDSSRDHLDNLLDFSIFLRSWVELR